MTTGEATVPCLIMVAGGLMPASLHISMVPIIIIQSLIPIMALCGSAGKVGIIPSSSQR